MLFFGRLKRPMTYSDSDWAQRVNDLVETDNIDSGEAMEKTSKEFCDRALQYNYYFLNPLIFNFLDDSCIDRIAWINPDGTMSFAEKHEAFKEKLTVMGIGEVLADSTFVF